MFSPLIEGFLKVGFDEEGSQDLELIKSIKVSYHLAVGIYLVWANFKGTDLFIPICLLP